MAHCWTPITRPVRRKPHHRPSRPRRVPRRARFTPRVRLPRARRGSRCRAGGLPHISRSMQSATSAETPPSCLATAACAACACAACRSAAVERCARR
eukprot:1284440-Prymnesium_polylepis.2